MLSLNSLRAVCSSRAAAITLHPTWLMTNRLFVNKAVTCPAYWISSSSSLIAKDAWHRNVNARASAQERGLTCSTKQANSLRSYCTGQVRLNCWNCKTPLDKTPVFFCMSCNVVQPPEEGASYFKIMDWWVSFSPWCFELLYIYTFTQHLMMSCVASFQRLLIHTGHTKAAEKILAAPEVSTSWQLQPEICGRLWWREGRGVSEQRSAVRDGLWVSGRFPIY